jgi:hypothetical protein
MSVELISIGSDVLVRLDKLKNASTDAYINSATVTFTLKDSAGAAVQGPTSMGYVAASNGRYEGVITNATSTGLSQTEAYTVEVTATSGSYVLFRKLSCVARYRSLQ